MLYLVHQMISLGCLQIGQQIATAFEQQDVDIMRLIVILANNLFQIISRYPVLF